VAPGTDKEGVVIGDVSVQTMARLASALSAMTALAGTARPCGVRAGWWSTESGLGHPEPGVGGAGMARVEMWVILAHWR
jgi:hypothetical protein